MSSDDSKKSAHFRFFMTKGVFVHQRLMQMFREHVSRICFENLAQMFREFFNPLVILYSLNSLALKYSKMSSRKRIVVPLTEKKRYAFDEAGSTQGFSTRKSSTRRLKNSRSLMSHQCGIMLIAEERGRGAYRAIFRTSN